MSSFDCQELSMPYKCSVGGFKNAQVAQWLINLPRDDLKSIEDLKPSMRVYAKHFSEADFEHNQKKNSGP